MAFALWCSRFSMDCLLAAPMVAGAQSSMPLFISRLLTWQPVQWQMQWNATSRTILWVKDSLMKFRNKKNIRCLHKLWHGSLATRDNDHRLITFNRCSKTIYLQMIWHLSVPYDEIGEEQHVSCRADVSLHLKDISITMTHNLQSLQTTIFTFTSLYTILSWPHLIEAAQLSVAPNQIRT